MIDMNTSVIEKIYKHLCDKESRWIYSKRLMYSLTGDESYIDDLRNMHSDMNAYLAGISKDNENYVFGAGNFGHELVSLRPGYFKAFLDNGSEKWGSSIDGLKVLNPKDLKPAGDIKIYITASRYLSIIKDQLFSMGWTEENIVPIANAFHRLLYGQYFDLPTLEYCEDEIFVDAGAYDGDTALTFSRECPNFKHIYCFEPDIENKRTCEENLKKLVDSRQVDIISKGMWSRKMTLKFSDGLKAESAIGKDGGNVINVPVTSIDEELDNIHVTFIKMDIEGAELEALKGAEKHIRKYAPKLAISLYHKKEDVIKLPEYILSLNPDYRFFVRHYSISANETVLYCLP